MRNNHVEHIIKGIPEFDGPGVYMLKNINNGKIYIGASIHLRQRILSHDRSFRNEDTYCSIKLFEDVKKGHGFRAEIVEKYDSITRWKLRAREAYFVKLYGKSNELYNTAVVPTYDYDYFVNVDDKYMIKWLGEVFS